ncbi:MAG: hypothetical protein AAF490_02020 [Chloroflexota bacterium]
MLKLEQGTLWLWRLIKRDWGALLLYFGATILMTYPVAFKLNTNWVGFYDADTYVKLWDNWWITNQLASDTAYFTNVLFYPEGLDLSFHSISWTAAWMAWFFDIFVDPISAYNLTILMAVFLTGYGAYLLIFYLIQDQRIAWFGGAIYTFAPYHVTHTGGHPDLTHLMPIPLAALFLIDAYQNRRWQTAVLSAFCITVAAYTSFYIMNFAVLTIGVLVLFGMLIDKRWQNKQVWLITAVFSISVLLLLLPRLRPIFQNLASLTEAIELKFAADVGQSDLRSFITPSHFNPLFRNSVELIAERFGMNNKWPAYLGTLPLLLTFIAISWRKEAKQIWPWFAMGLMFLFLALGPVLRMNGVVFEGFRLSASYLSWFPPIRAVGRPDFFVLGLLLPLAVCASYGLKRLLPRLTGSKIGQTAFVTLLSTFLLFEYWNGFYQGGELPVSSFFVQLKEMPEDVAIINLPMGRNQSKPYVYYQTIHEKPILEGLSARTLPESYTYIRENRLLSNWHHQKPFDCSRLPDAVFAQSVSQLHNDGFQYIVVHHDIAGNIPEALTAYFPMPHHYQDELVTVFKTEDLHLKSSCG